VALNYTYLGSIPTTLIKVPGFQQAQQVSFIGGEGTVRSYTSEAGTWTYLVEMPSGLKPAFGRIGAETLVLLTEADLWSREAEAGCNFSICPRN